MPHHKPNENTPISPGARPRPDSRPARIFRDASHWHRCRITRLCRVSGLAAARLESANRLAAIRAALGAAADNEPDPLAYLRDEIAEEASAPGLRVARDKPRPVPPLPAACPPRIPARRIPGHVPRH